jgi:hypothetical protein
VSVLPTTYTIFCQINYKFCHRLKGQSRPKVKTKTVFSIFAKSENDAKISKFSWKCLFLRKFLFPKKFSRNWVRFCEINMFKMINSNGNLTLLVHVHYWCPICFEAPSWFDNFEVHGGQYCCPICFEAPSRFDNFEVHGGQYCCPICFAAPSGFNNFEVHGQYSCPICFETPSGVDNRGVHVHYCCPICFEAQSGFDILRYYTIFPVSRVRLLKHFHFRENVHYFCNFS